MKARIIIVFFILLIWSCNSSINETIDKKTALTDETSTLLNAPIEEVKLTVLNETFTIDFRFNTSCELNMSNWDLSEPFAKIKTRDDLLNYYETSHAPIQIGYSSLMTNHESVFAMLEYKLAQECFSDNCDSEFRKKVLQLATNFQKQKYLEYSVVSCAKKSGVFLMAVILVKEIEHTIKFINGATLQEALLCLNKDNYVSEDFSNFIIECSENFLTNSKN